MSNKSQKRWRATVLGYIITKWILAKQLENPQKQVSNIYINQRKCKTNARNKCIILNNNHSHNDKGYRRNAVGDSSIARCIKAVKHELLEHELATCTLEQSISPRRTVNAT